MFQAKTRIDYFFQLSWKRLRSKFEMTTIERHEAQLMRALYNRRARQESK